MLGFPKKAIYVVIVILFIAYYAGGLWLVLPIVLALTWYVIEQQEGKKAATTSEPLDEPTQREPGKAIDWTTRLTEICSNYSANNYYVSESIPGRKLKNAEKSYPLPKDGKVIALIDTTTLGAHCGMLIGEHGISWNNWSTETKVSVLSWKELSDMTLSKDGCKINFGDIGVFDFMYDDRVMEKIIELLNSIRLTYVEYSKDYWFKVVDYLQLHFALIDMHDASKATVFFIDDLSCIFDHIIFPSLKCAQQGLRKNGFKPVSEDKNAQEFIAAIKLGPPFEDVSHKNMSIYSSGRFWKS